MTETELHILTAEWIALKAQSDERYKWFYHCPNGGLRDKRTAAKLKAMGVQPGIPDWQNPYITERYNGLAIELKSKDGRLSKDQEKWLKFLRSQGRKCAVCNDFEAFKKGVETYFGG